MYVCYLLLSTVSNRTYIGVTNNIRRRLLQHNGKLSGGAKYTQSCRPWKCHAIVGPFGDKRRALSFEWHWKRARGGVRNRCIKLNDMVTRAPIGVLVTAPITADMVLGSTYSENVVEDSVDTLFTFKNNE